MSSPTQEGSPSLAALMQWQHTIQAAEQQWGSSHPAVGRAWLELARALQAADKDSDRAKHATKKAFDICMTSMKQTGTVGGTWVVQLCLLLWSGAQAHNACPRSGHKQRPNTAAG
jgi:hypothetical protein